MSRGEFRAFISPEDENPARHLGGFFVEKEFAVPQQKRFDWRDRGLSFRIRDQRNWNACTSFAIAAMVESRRSLSNLGGERLVASDVHCCLAQIAEPAHPLNPRRAGEYCAQHGIAKGPADPLPPSPQACAGFSRIAVPASDYEWVLRHEILNLLVRDGPMLTDMYVPRDFDQLGAHQVYIPPPDPEPMLHSMCLVGFDYDARIAILLNSMGASWGNQGYLHAQFGGGGLLERYPYVINYR